MDFTSYRIETFHISKASEIPLQTSGCLGKLYPDCFNLSFEQVGNFPDTDLYMMSSDDEGCMATAAFTTDLSMLLPEYRLIPALYLYNVCVSSAYRGKGVMRYMLETIIDTIDPNLPIYLLVDRNNTPAVKLYLRLGFEALAGVQFKEDPKIYIIMVKVG